jgi:2TM domain
MKLGAFSESLAVMALTELEQPSTEREQTLLRVKKRRDLQAHLVAYLVINAAVWAIWAVSGTGYPWPAWVTGGWAIGLLLNAWDVYFRRPITEADVQREIRRLHPRH